MALSNEDDVPDQNSCQSYGWFGCRPKFLTSCLTPRWVLFSCCLLVFTQGFVVTGITGVAVTSIEKRYFLRSSQIGIIFAFYEVGGIILTILVSYFGHNNKPKYLGIGSLVLSLGCLTFALPQLLVGLYEPVTTQASDLCAANQTTVHNATHGTTEMDCKDLGWYVIFVLVLGQFVIGAGASPIFNVGAKYVEENASRNNAGIFLGIYYCFAICGAGMGFLVGGYFLAIYVDVVQVLAI